MELNHLGIGTMLSWSLTKVHDSVLECEGINNSGKCREISSRLNQMNVDMVILVETRVKQSNFVSVRRKLGQRWSFRDNYSKHKNGRIWILWDD